MAILDEDAESGSSPIGGGLPPATDWEPDLLAVGWRLPKGRFLKLPGRGTTWVREIPGPPGAPVLFLLHGLGATGGLNWFSSIAVLGERFRVITIDHRGHGRGVRTRRFRLADCADDAACVAEMLGIDRFIAVGYSMGGPIAQLLWFRHRSKVSGLVLCATSRNFRGNPRERVQFAGLGAIAAATSLPLPRFAMGPAWPLLAQMLTRGGYPGLRAWLTEEVRHHDANAVLQATDALGRFSSHSWIGAVDVPASVVLTTGDQLVPSRRQVKLAESIPTAVIHPVDGDHMVVARKPEAFASALLEACELVARRGERWHPLRSTSWPGPRPSWQG